MSTFFIEIVPNLGTKVDKRYLCDASNISDPTEKAIQNYKNHPSISIIKKTIFTVDKNNKFFFELITADDISREIKRLDINKATQESDIPKKLVKRFDLPSCLIYLKFTNVVYMTKCILISVIFSLNIDVTFVRDTMPNTAN